MISLTVARNKYERGSYLFKGKKAYIVATSEMDGAHGLPRATRSLVNEIQ